MDSKKDPKDELEGLIHESKKNSKKIIEQAREFLKMGQFMNDLAEASEKVIKNTLSSGICWEPLIDAWKYANEQQDKILTKMGTLSLQSITSTGSAVAYAMSEFANPNNINQFVSINNLDEARNASMELAQVIDKFTEKDNILRLLQQYGLSNATPDRKSPSELFKTAWEAFEGPVKRGNPADTSLIPMRECINSTIAEMLRRRPRQEPAKSQREKIISIFRQIGEDGISEWAVENMATRWEKLVGELSSSKQKNYSRDEWRNCLRRASLFLMEFLQSLDPSKMK